MITVYDTGMEDLILVECEERWERGAVVNGNNGRTSVHPLSALLH